MHMVVNLWVIPGSEVELKKSEIKSIAHILGLLMYFNLLTPNVNYTGRTAPLTSKFAFYIFIQQI